MGILARRGASCVERIVFVPISREHVAIYVAKIEQFWFREDKPGVIFLMNTESLDQAKSKIHELPLAANGFLGFEFIPVGPLYVQVDCSTLHRM